MSKWSSKVKLYLQVADFLGQLFNEMVGPDIIRYLTVGFSLLKTDGSEQREVCHPEDKEQTEVMSPEGIQLLCFQKRPLRKLGPTLTSLFNQVFSALIKALTPSTR